MTPLQALLRLMRFEAALAVLLVAVGWGTLRFGLFSSPGDMTVFFGGIAMRSALRMVESR